MAAITLYDTAICVIHSQAIIEMKHISIHKLYYIVLWYLISAILTTDRESCGTCENIVKLLIVCGGL